VAGSEEREEVAVRVVYTLLLATVLAACGRPESPTLAAVAFSANAYRLDDGQPISSLEDVSERSTVVVVWWDPACAWCRAQLSELQQGLGRLHAIGVDVIGISLARQGAQEVVDGLHLTYPIVIEPNLGAPTGFVPYTVLVREGEKLGEWIGFITVDDILTTIGGG
jgi:hypothetical protein